MDAEDPNRVVLRSMDVSSIAEALNRATRLLGLPQAGEAYGCGTQGCAAPLGPGRVLKLTTDPLEVAAVEAAYDDRRFDGFARVFQTPSELWSTGNQVWGYVREEITPFRLEKESPIRQALTELKKASDFRNERKFEKALPEVELLVPGIGAFARRLYGKGLMLGDMHSQNLGLRPETGELVLFDARAYERLEGWERAMRERRGENPLSNRDADKIMDIGLPAAWHDLMADAPDAAAIAFLKGVVKSAERVTRVKAAGVYGCGVNGCALPTKDGRVLKISTEPSERTLVELAYRLKAPGFARIDIPPRSLDDDNPEDEFAYVREDVTPLPWTGHQPLINDLRMLSRALNAADYHAQIDAIERKAGPKPTPIDAVLDTLRFFERAGVLIGDLHRENIGTRADGSLVIFDASTRPSSPSRASNPIAQTSVPLRVPKWLDLPDAVTKAELRLRVRTLDRVYGCGVMGCAMPIVGGGVLKITSDPAEVLAAQTVFFLKSAEARAGYARIATLPVKISSHHWAYVREEIQPIAPWLVRGGPAPPAVYWVAEKISEAALLRGERRRARA